MNNHAFRSAIKLILISALLTTTLMTLRASRRNPVETLRYE